MRKVLLPAIFGAWTRNKLRIIMLDLGFDMTPTAGMCFDS